MTPGPTTPALVHSTPLVSKLRWCVGKHVRISVHWLVCGSNMPRWRFAPPLSGNALAAGWLEPDLHQSGFGSGLMREVYQVRAFSSIIGLWLSVRPSQYGLSPQYADTPYGLPFTEGVLSSRTGWCRSIAVFVRGSSTATMSVESSGEAYTAPFGFTRGSLRSVDTTSCR